MIQALEASPRVGIHEAPNGQKDFVLIAKLAGKLNKAKFRSWVDVLQSDLTHRVGPTTMRRLTDFESKLFEHKRRPISNSAHTIEVSSYGKSKYYKRSVCVIDGIPIVFVDRTINENMARLLQGGTVFIGSRDNSTLDIRQEVGFLNEYFGLGLNVWQKPIGKIVKISLRKQKGIELITRETATPVR